MKWSLTTRSLVTFLGLDLLFCPSSVVAFSQQLGMSDPSPAYPPLIVAAVLKFLSTAVAITVLLTPYEQFQRLPERERTRSSLLAADRALQTSVLRFSLISCAAWVVFFGGAFVALWNMDPERVPIPSSAPTVLALTLVSQVLGAFSFTYPLMRTITSDAGMACSTAARKIGTSLDRVPSSVQALLGVVAIAIALGPTTWVISASYLTQLQESRQRLSLEARLAANKVASAVRDAAAPTGAELDAIARSVAGPEAHALVLGTKNPNSDQERLLAAEPAVGKWLTEQANRAPSGSHQWPRSDRTLAYERVGDTTVAVLIPRPPAASSLFVSSSTQFAIVAVVWALITATIIGRAVSVPLERLTGTARRVVEEGNLKEIGEIPVARSDEIGLLTDQFNNVVHLMRSLGDVANRIAAGDLTTDVPGKGELPDAFRNMLGSLQTIVRQIRESSMDLASAATEIFAAAQEQEAAATTQSSGMIEISRTMDSLSESAAHVSDAVGGVLSNAERALQNTDEMVRRIGELTAHANRIAEILEVIRDIADKSDLLALNGSLEASRAGEGGRGFALVAAEMRRLAERVTASVHDVKRLVTDIRDSGSSTVMATEESKKLAHNTTDAARQITFVTQQQRTGTEQVSASIKNIAEVVSQAASATSQTRTSAESLKVQADRLAEIVKGFDVLAGVQAA